MIAYDVALFRKETKMINETSDFTAEYQIEIPSYQEDPAFYDYDRMKYIRIMECFDPIVLSSARKPTLDEQEGSISYEN